MPICASVSSPVLRSSKGVSPMTYRIFSMEVIPFIAIIRAYPNATAAFKLSKYFTVQEETKVIVLPH